MCQWVLQQNDKIVPRRTLKRLIPNEVSPHSEVEARERKDFNEEIERKLGNPFTLKLLTLSPQHTRSNKNDEEDPKSTIDFDPDNFVPYKDEEEPPSLIPEADMRESTGKHLNQQLATDLLINAEVLLPQGESNQMAKVVRRAIGRGGNVVGTFNNNPVLNTLVYDVEFSDGSVKQYAANVIVENVLNQVNSKGRSSCQLDGIISHRRNRKAVSKKDAFLITKRVRRKLRETTVGWEFLVRWCNCTSQWMPLKILKESNPVEIAEYAKSWNIADEPDVAWWEPYTLKKKNMIVAKNGFSQGLNWLQ